MISMNVIIKQLFGSYSYIRVNEGNDSGLKTERNSCPVFVEINAQELGNVK